MTSGLCTGIKSVYYRDVEVFSCDAASEPLFQEKVPEPQHVLKHSTTILERAHLQYD